AGADAAAAVDLHAAVVVEIAVGMAGKADLETSDFDLADLAGRQRPTVGVDDREPVIREWPPDGAEPPLLAGTGRDPAGLARAIPLSKRKADPVLEPPPFLGCERCRARRQETQRWKIATMRIGLGIEQDVDGGRVAGGDRDAVLADMPEEAAGRELRR